ncbi:MAG: hypothetical protein J7L79_00800 [Thaumarchaeota archaeon]|nr:hypothetical protein [Nitrososphaerota archaeon]
MKAKKLGKKGLSPLLAIIIGLIVTIVAGILLAQLYFSYAATISARPAANIEYSELIVSDGSGILALNIKNVGNVPINSITVYDENGKPVSGCSIYYSGTTTSTYTVRGGRVISVTCSGISASAGDVKSFTVVIGFTDDSTQAYAISVRARSA